MGRRVRPRGSDLRAVLILYSHRLSERWGGAFGHQEAMIGFEENQSEEGRKKRRLEVSQDRKDDSEWRRTAELSAG
ncbi:hypothetical protein PVK06_012070 [Gossypium arboreum]|uniref:Uncharacterized protein n=1 Tax=Gossypium arboreum TaxID=29729 RepID=A0ABR0QAI6_GOSAR|nr:hypothetical protein PVK06_012070 [Gossypium arboreum]